MAKVVTADEAVALVPDGGTLLIVPMPSEEVYPAFGRQFKETGSPKDLTVLWAAGLGPFSEEPQGMNHFAVPGMMKRLIAAHIGLNHAVMKMVAMNQCETYILPQGVMCQLYREIGGGRPGLLTRVGLGTFIDPRIEGGKANQVTQDCEDLAEVVEVGGREHLLYKRMHIDAAVIRGTAVDPAGNITADDEAIRMENFEAAMAARNSGGIVIAQVQEVLDAPVNPHHVFVPGVFVDYVVVAQTPEAHPHTLFTQHDDTFTGKKYADLAQEIHPMPLGPEKVICRRAAMELRPEMNVNLGIGIPMGVAQVAFEEGLLDALMLNTEIGVLGGLPEGGTNFGPAKNPKAFISQAAMFDFYDGGGLDATCVGMAQADKHGNVNVSRLGPKVIGCGGFVNITQSAQKCCFCGEFSAVGHDATVENGRLLIREHGKVAKFMDHVEQITFSGDVARRAGQEVLYITERCVFQLVPEGLKLIEVAPGVDMQADILDRMDFQPIVPDDVKPMAEALFQEAPLGMPL
ncbi:MAG: acyl CoA:acetate/3-ketoacid CoA transferase [Candidatus Hydrogenedentota bacterium]